MKKSMTRTSLTVVMVSAVLLAACGDKVQNLDSGSASKQDASAFSGTGSTTFTAAGWKPGDKASWEQHLKTRMQNGQNDYSKAN